MLAPISAEARTCSASGSMNKLTRVPFASKARTVGSSETRSPATSSPPSVVTSSRCSGTRQTNAGFTSKAIDTISGVFPISKFINNPGSLRNSHTSAS